MANGASEKKRDPSIHIRKKAFYKLCFEASKKGMLKENKVADLVEFLFNSKEKYNCNHRVVLVSNDRVEKKVTNLLRSDKPDNQLMAMIILAFRRSKKHLGVRLINQTSREWDILKKITEDANEFYQTFHEDFNDKKDAYKTYIEIGSSKMQKFGINKLVNMAESIGMTHQSNRDMRELSHLSQTANRAYNLYTQRIYNQTGIPINYQDNPDKMISFYHIAKYCTDKNIPVNIYLDAQFNGFGFRDILPEPLQMVGQKAEERVSKFLFDNGITAKKTNKKEVDFKAILNTR